MTQKKLFEKPEIRYLKNALLIYDEILVIGDLHLGYEDEIVRESILPNIQLRDVLSDLKKIFDILESEKIERLKEIVLLGDIKHEFSNILNSEWRDISRLLGVLEKKCDKLVIIKGNHDTKLGPILRKKNSEKIVLKDYYKIKQKNRNYWFLHGNKVFKQLFKQSLDSSTVRQMFRQTDRQVQKKDILFMGHLHPAISLADEYKKERYKCFLCGKWKGFIVYILPSFSLVSEGYDLRNLDVKRLNEVNKRKGRKVRKHDFFIIEDKDLMKFKISVYDEDSKKSLEFGVLKKLIKNT
jgi:uncharacterized protein